MLPDKQSHTFLVSVAKPGPQLIPKVMFHASSNKTRLAHALKAAQFNDH
jgi:hypothetical protein